MNIMKKIIAGVILAASSTMVMANGPAGCGLGTEVIFKDANEWHEHILAATTNQSASQTMAMTSGTMGCEAANGPLAGVQTFMDNNMDQLAMDVAKGQGETLAALAEIIGVEATDTTIFNSKLQANFDTMFSIEATSGTAYQAMKNTMKSDLVLKKYLG
jgi:ABC-type transport system involved in Fe-S cluster assembly fused permease/ATPase subunit